jgi:hypothetical protein
VGDGSSGYVETGDRFEGVLPDDRCVVEPRERRRADLAAHRRDQDRRVGLTTASERRRLRQRQEQAAGLVALVGAQAGIPRRMGQAIESAHRRTRDDRDGQVHLLDHPANEEELLRIFLTEVRAARPGQVEETVHDLQDAVEMTGPGRTLERLADRARVWLGQRDIRGIDLLHGGSPDRVDAESSTELEVSRLIARIGREVLTRCELRRVDEDRDEQPWHVATGPPDQRGVPLMEGAHRGDQPHRRCLPG